MAKNVMKMLKPSPKRGKNAFDLSHRHICGANFGELLPITCLETVPGDYFEVNCADLLRAMPMVTSPFLRAKQHIDFWFVPYTDLWHNFNAFITQKEQPQSAALKNARYCPHFGLGHLADIYQDPEDYNVGDDIIGRDWKDGCKKLFGLLGYGDITGMPGSSQINPMPDANLWRIAAYNYIWYNEYRQSYYDDGKNLLDTNPAMLFNFDDLPCDTYTNADIRLGNITYGDTRLAAMFQMRYRCWKKDLFTGLMPSTQFGDVSAVNFANGTLFKNAYVKSITENSTGRQLRFDNETSLLSTFGNQTTGADSNHVGIQLVNPDGVPYSIVALRSGSDTPPNFDILALRNAQAVQIWRENALRSGNRVNDNMNGHFGEYPSYQRDHRPVYIGSYDEVLNISDVNATAQTGTGGNESLGDVAGKGLSSLDSRKLKFQCNDFGVIMGIFSLLPEAEYNATGIDRPNQLIDRFDYFAPEMENLGLEAVSSLNFLVTPSSTQSVLGYAPRYFAYKTRLDKVFGEFMTNKSLQIWASPKFDVYQALSISSSVLPLKVLYVNPSIFDVNFVADAETIGEQFLCDFFFNVEAVRPMTVLGLPTA